MSRYDDLVAEALTRVSEIMPWDLSRSLAAGSKPVLLDVRSQAEFDTDPDRVYLTGLSMGGTGTWSIATKDPSAWAAIVPMCASPNLPGVEKFIAARLPVWNFCGDKDREGIVKANREMQALLTKAGVEAKYTEYPGVGHNCWDEAYATDALYKWLLQQTRSKNQR